MGVAYLNNDEYVARLTNAEYDKEMANWWPGIPDDIETYRGKQDQLGIEVSLPFKYTARDYQADNVWTPFFEQQYRRMCIIWHRRAGKDKTLWNLTIAASQQRVGLYFYMLPKVVQSRKVIWDGRGKDGAAFREHIPDELSVKQNTSTMTIYLANGSIIQLVGADNYDALMGTNPLGIVFSEFSLQDPRAWDYFRPILAENGGWALMDYTPRGRNHGYQLMKTAQKSKNWFLSLLTVDDTRDEHGKPIITQEAIEDEMDEGMTEDMVQQEFYCSFDAANQGAIFGKEMATAWREGRVLNLPVEPTLRTFTFWDLGFADEMAIWILQAVGSKELRMIGFYCNRHQGMGHYIHWLRDFQKEHSITWDTHYAPHDIEVHELMPGKTRIETAKEMGITFTTVERCKSKEDSIEAAKRVLPYVYFDEKRCEKGVNAMTDYQRKYDEKRDVYTGPDHTWASNGADAFQQFGMIWSDAIIAMKKAERQKKRGRKGFM